MQRPEQQLHDPYLAARREWDERYVGSRRSARVWRILAFTAVALALVLALIDGALMRQAKVVPYVVEVDKLGDALAVRAADQASPTDARVAKASVAAWITDVRTVSSDDTVERRALTRVYSFTTGSAVSFLDDYFRGHSPFAHKETVAASIDAVLPLSDRTFEAEWHEDPFDMLGRALPSTHWVARLSLTFNPPSDESSLLVNPLGIYVTSITWTQRL